MANQELKNLQEKLKESKTVDEPRFERHSARKRAAAAAASGSDEETKTPTRAAYSRNDSTGLKKNAKLGTIEEDESETLQKTLSPSQQKDVAEPKIPSLNLNQDNLREKASEKVRQDRIQQQL